jgi:glyoxylase-like metal-dependent hydrolase (beta-lactamase superfamily II)
MKGVNIRFIEAGHSSQLEAMAVQGGAWRSIRFPGTVAVIRHPKEGVLLFDTGYTPRYYEETREFPNKIYRLTVPVEITEEQTASHQLRKMGIATTDVSKIILSHFHADHVAGCRDFEQSKFIYAKEAYTAVKDLGPIASVKHAFLKGLLPDDFERLSSTLSPENFLDAKTGYPEFETGCDLLGDGSVVAVELPGHTCGQIGLMVKTETQGDFFLVADACWQAESFEKDIPSHPVTRLVHANYKRYRETLSKIHRLFLHTSHTSGHTSANSPALRIVPCHCEKTCAGLPRG